MFLSCSSASSDSNAAVRADVTSSKPSKKLVVFDADTAMRYLEKQVGFGPRVPGTEAHARCADWLAESLRQMGANVTDNTVSTPHPVDRERNIDIRNIFASFNPAAQNRVIVLAHYDTRPWADEDPDAANHNKPIDGANDGASGVAVALEIARHAASLPNGKGLDILFVDQEDSGNSGDDASWCIGSDFWARNLPYTPSSLPRFGILLDMVGGKDATFMREYFSQTYAPAINDMVWKTAASLGYGDTFVNRQGGAINDDHISLLRAGIPTVDIIDTRPDGFAPTWHTLQDNIENIDPQTLGIVGDVITEIIYKP